MMAKMFYTLDEAKAALGRNEEDIKQYAREGRLREFRDGPRLMFKADQVEALKSELASGGGGGGGAETIDLIGSDTGAPIGLVDSKNASAGGSAISLVDTDAGSAPGLGGSVGGTRGPGSSGSAIALAGTGTGSGMPLKEDTALAADLGLSGSMGGVPSPGRPGSGLSLGGTAHGTRSGINVFQADEVEHADPSAQTNIASGYPDQVTLDAVGSGSGLLDLTRESDDTSLGAELLDEIAPSGSGSGRTRSGTPTGAVVVADDSDVAPVITPGAPSRRTMGQPVYVEQADPAAPFFGGLALGAVFFILFASTSLIAGVLGTKNPLAVVLNNPQDQPRFGLLILAGIGAGVGLVFGLGGWLVGKSSR